MKWNIPVNWRRREVLILYWYHFNLRLQSLFSSLSLVSGLNYKLKTEIQLLINYLRKNLNPKNKEKKLKLVFSLSFSVKCSIYREKPNGGERTKIGGANAPPTDSNKPRKRGFGRVSTARVWPGGHTRGVELPGFVIWCYLLLDLQFWVLDLTKRPLIFGFNRLILEDLF